MHHLQQPQQPALQVEVSVHLNFQLLFFLNTEYTTWIPWNLPQSTKGLLTFLGANGLSVIGSQRF